MNFAFLSFLEVAMGYSDVTIKSPKSKAQKGAASPARISLEPLPGITGWLETHL